MFKKEFRIILYTSCRSLFEKKKNEVVELLEESLDWRFIYNASLFHRTYTVLPILMEKAYLFNYIPLEIRQKYQALIVIEKKNRDCVNDSFADLCREMVNRGLDVIMLKGITLRDRLWEGLLRPMGDIDLFVSSSHIHLAKEILFSLGYQKKKIIGSAFAENILGEVVFNLSSRKMIEVEISFLFNKKTELQNIYKLNVDWMISKLVREEYQNIPVYRLGEYQEFQFIMYHHLSLNNLNKILYLGDLLEYMRFYHNSLDWERVGYDSIKCGQRYSFGILMNLAKELLELDFGSLNRSTRLMKKCKIPLPLKKIFDTSTLAFVDMNIIEQKKNLIRGLLLPNIKCKIKYIIKRMIPSPAYLRWRIGFEYPKANLAKLYFIYFLTFSKDLWRTTKGLKSEG